MKLGVRVLADAQDRLNGRILFIFDIIISYTNHRNNNKQDRLTCLVLFDFWCDHFHHPE